ncbi:pseudouridine synthase [Brachybacterium sp. SGAir0954]|uniref:pseudouridine synthase n=1 Tax=Brachybacterium sp. SGAir0954 TaxID=2571029 RepID=UPI00143D7C05|nr:pseudouridine synthase [Brachybacterium sp. SGAir0954]
MSASGPGPRPGRAARRRARRPPAPLPQRDGLDPVRWSVPPAWDGPTTALAALLHRFPPLAAPAATSLADRFRAGEVVRTDGTPWAAEDAVHPGEELWFHRELAAEEVPPARIPVLLHDAHLLVVDKPHDMATMPRGAHVRSSLLVRLRRETGIAELSPLHRLDRRTAGVIALGIRAEERSAYQQLFAARAVRKEYLARVRPAEGSTLPKAVGERALLEDRLEKHHGELTTRVLPGEPNSSTELEVLDVEADGTLLLRLVPLTGRTHQLRAQLSSRGAPIVGEDLYPSPAEAARTAGGGALQLLARGLAFTDPVTGEARHVTSTRTLGPGPRTLAR